VAVALFAVGLVLYRQQPDDPVYRGRHLSSWLDELRGSSTDPTDTNPGVIAVRAIGTNGLPFLISRLQLKYSRPRAWLVQISEKQSILKLNLKSDLIKRAEASDALITLGEAARPVLPDLERMIQQSDEDVAMEVTPVLGNLGRDGFQILAKGLTNKNGVIRWVSVIQFVSLDASNPTNLNSEALFKFRRDASVGIPALVVALNDRNPRIAHAAAWALADIHLETNIVVPALQQLAENTNTTESVRKRARKSLATFGVYKSP
jgi:hypothetical protein